MPVNTEDSVAATRSPSPAVTALGLSLVHDATAPLTSLVLLAAAGQRWLAGDRPNLEEARLCFADIAAHTQSLLDLFDTVSRTVTRTVSRNMAPAVPPSPFDLRALLHDIGTTINRADTSPGGGVWLDLPPAPVTIHGNPWQLRQTLLIALHLAMPDVVTHAVDPRATTDTSHAVAVTLTATDAEATVEIRALSRHARRPRHGAPTLNDDRRDEIAVLDAVMRLHGGSLRHGAPGTDEPCLIFGWPRQPDMTPSREPGQST